MNGEELCLGAWETTIRDSPWTHNLGLQQHGQLLRSEEAYCTNEACLYDKNAYLVLYKGYECVKCVLC